MKINTTILEIKVVILVLYTFSTNVAWLCYICHRLARWICNQIDERNGRKVEAGWAFIESGQHVEPHKARHRLATTKVKYKNTKCLHSTLVCIVQIVIFLLLLDAGEGDMNIGTTGTWLRQKRNYRTKYDPPNGNGMSEKKNRIDLHSDSKETYFRVFARLNVGIGKFGGRRLSFVVLDSAKFHQRINEQFEEEE